MPGRLSSGAACITGNPPPPALEKSLFDPASMATYLYAATPITQNQTGTRGFGIDHSGLLCFTTDGSIPPNNGGSGLAPTCTPVK
jgi:hypothetical protein